MQCKKGYEVQVLMSGAGYYIGTMDNTYFPFTGRELHSEPTECVKEILNLLERINNL